jgi:hypothetical protein
VGKFPVDAPKARVLRALEALGFRLVRERDISRWCAITLMVLAPR